MDKLTSSTNLFYFPEYKFIATIDEIDVYCLEKFYVRTDRLTCDVVETKTEYSEISFVEETDDSLIILKTPKIKPLLEI